MVVAGSGGKVAAGNGGKGNGGKGGEGEFADKDAERWGGEAEKEAGNVRDWLEEGEEGL